MKNFDFKIPDIAAGKVVPHIVQQKEFEEERAEEERKKQFRHDWLIACFSGIIGIISGAIGGVLATIIYNAFCT